MLSNVDQVGPCCQCRYRPSGAGIIDGLDLCRMVPACIEKRGLELHPAVRCSLGCKLEIMRCYVMTVPARVGNDFWWLRSCPKAA